MNGARTTFRRKGYLLTALAAAVLLAASSGTAYAQSIGFTTTSGTISEDAYLNRNALDAPQRIIVRVDGLPASGSARTGAITGRLGAAITIAPSGAVYMARVDSDSGAFVGEDGTSGADDLTTQFGGDEDNFVIPTTAFEDSDEVELVVAQSEAGVGDANWLDEMIQFKLTVAASGSVSPDLYMLTVEDEDVAPVAKFDGSSFTLTEDTARVLTLDVVEGRRFAGIPAAIDDTDNSDIDGPLSVRVGNFDVVTLGDCPKPGTLLYNRRLVKITLNSGIGDDGWVEPTSDSVFKRTGVLQTVETTHSVSDLADLPPETGDADVTEAVMTLTACEDMAGVMDRQITLTILDTNLRDTRSASDRTRGDITQGPPVVVTLQSDEAAPTLSFSPTDVEIDEGGSTSTVLLAEGMNSGDIGKVKLSVEGDAMVSLMQDGEMLEEMDGHVYVDLGGNSSARLTAMSHSDPDLMDGEMAFKAWKLMEGGTDGAMIGEGYWFKVDVRGSTAVPALPLLGQLLLALFLMAGGARLYRRRQG